jgi:hypothetical protein
MASTTLYSKDEEQKKATEGTGETTSPNAVVTTDDPSTPTTTTQGGDNTPSTTDTATQTTTEPENPYEVRLGQLRAEVEAEEEAYTKQNEAYARRLEKVRAAKENHRSVIASIAEDQKPKYDENRAKKLRNIAIVQSLGDMLSAAARGYFAYRKGGAGVVPNVKTDSPFKPLDEINKMREEYLKRNEEWKELDASLKIKQSEAEIAAEEALATKYEQDLKQRRTEVEKRRKMYDDWLAKQIKSEEDAYRDAAKMANQNEQKRLDREAADRRSYASIAAADRRAERTAEQKKDKEWSIEDYKLVEEYRKAHPKKKIITVTDEVTGVKTTKEVPYSQKDYDSQSEAARKEELVRAKYEKKRKEVYDELIKMGKTPDQANKDADDYMTKHYNK